MKLKQVALVAGELAPVREQIFDILGKQVLTTENANLVNIQSLTAGMYIVKAVQNGAITTTKLIVE